MRTTLLKTLGISAATAALALFAYGASAQDAKKKEPAKKPPPACKTIKAQAACEAREDCSWVAETKDKKGKVTKKAYCKAKPKPPAKKADPKKK